MSPTYDLMLLLDASADDDRREKIIGDVESAISSQGALVGRHDWGLRPLAYEILHATEAHYHLFQFDGPPELLEQLDRYLRITDGVTRFRIIKLRPGTPPPPDARPERPPRAGAPAVFRGGGRGHRSASHNSAQIGASPPVPAARLGTLGASQ